MVKYLYNGVELPTLPEWDIEQYPYAIIIYGEHYVGDEEKYTRLYVSPNPFVILDQSLLLEISGDLPITFLFCNLGDDGDEWNDFTEHTVYEIPNITPVFSTIDLFWSNHDLYYSTDTNINGELAGTLYLAASTPIPVGGVPALTARDLYRKINGKPTKLTLYKKINNKLVALDEHTKEVKT